MANAKLRYRKIKALRELSNGYPLQSPSTGGLDNETGVNFWSLINGSTAKQPKPVSGEITLAATER